MPDLFQVVVLAAHAQTFLTVGHPLGLGRLVAEEDVLELVHTGIGEHQRGVVLHHHRRRRYDLVLFFAEKIEENSTNLVGIHISDTCSFF